jgi:hypothetical protein
MGVSAAVLAIVIGISAFGANVIDLQTDTIKAWEEYVREADARMQTRLGGQTPFLWIDESPDRSRRIKEGEIVVAPAVSHGTQHVPNGLIHDWIGGVFIPGAKVERLFAVMQDYDKYKDFFKPAVIDSKLLACTAGGQRFSMLWLRKVLFVTAAMKGEYEARQTRVDSRRGYGVSRSVQLQEIENYGTAQQKLLAPGTGNGYLWRLHSITRYEQRDDGVYLEVEAMALTRDIPASVRWLAKPVIHRLSMNSLTTMLQEIRDAVKSAPADSTARSSCPNQ